METTYTQNQPKKYYPVAFLFLLATSLALYFFVSPLWVEVDSLAKGRDDKLVQKADLQTVLTDLQLVQQELNAGTEVNRETSLASIPERLEEDKLIADIVKIAKASQVFMGGISFSIPGSSMPGEISRAGISLNLTGTQGSLLTFLRGVESNARKIVVNSISVQMATTEGGEPLANFNVNMDTYYQGMI